MTQIPWLNWLWEKILGLFIDRREYKLIVWYVYEEFETNGVKSTKRKEREYILRDIFKRSNTHILGKTLDGNRFEIKTVTPFDYEVTRIR